MERAGGANGVCHIICGLPDSSIYCILDTRLDNWSIPSLCRQHLCLYTTFADLPLGSVLSLFIRILTRRTDTIGPHVEEIHAYVLHTSDECRGQSNLEWRVSRMQSAPFFISFLHPELA